VRLAAGASAFRITAIAVGVTWYRSRSPASTHSAAAASVPHDATDGVPARTRQANRSINDRFETLAHEQIERAIAWLESRSPSSAALEKLRKAAEPLQPGD